MKRQKAIIKNSALPKVTKVIVESEPNLVAENIRKGVTILGVEGTYEDGASGGLTPFTVGQRINGITIDPTAKTDEEMIEWLNTFSIGAGTADYVVLLKGKQDGSVGDIVLAGLQGNIRTLAFLLTEDVHVWFMSEGIPEAGIESKGWYIINEKGETATPITEKTTLNGNTYEVAEIADQFAFLNGIVLGAVEATNVPEVPQETLTPFGSGQTISAIKVNTNAKTNEELSAFVAKSLEGQGDSKTLVSDSNGAPLIGIRGNAESGYIISAESDNSNNIFWVSKDLNLDGKFTFPSAGWYLVNEDTSSVEEVSGIVELSFTATVTTSGNNDIAFDELNGTVFGVVKA